MDSPVTGAIIQARMGSTRLPGKVLAEAAGRPLLAHMIERLQRAETLDRIVVATTLNPEDDAIVRVAKEAGVAWSRGPEEDVLWRVLESAKSHGIDVIVELTADCPLLDPHIVDLAVREYWRWRDSAMLPTMDFVTNHPDAMTRSGYPRGMDVRVFATDVLARVESATTDPADREHVSLYVWEHPREFEIRYLTVPPEYHGDARLTVDTDADLQLVRIIFDTLYSANPEFGLREILALLATRADLREINRHVEQRPVR